MVLDHIFQLQEERKVDATALHYRRTRYVLEQTPETHDLKGKRVEFFEDDHGFHPLPRFQRIPAYRPSGPPTRP